MGSTTYQKIWTEPLKIIQIGNFRVIRQANEHTKLYISGVLEDIAKASYAEDAKEAETIRLKAMVSDDGKEGKEKIMFSGIIQTLEVVAVAGIYHINLEAVSHSYKLDIEKTNRSYQKAGTPYSKLMTEAMEDIKKCDDAKIMDKITDNAATDKFILQYRETAWEFLKRMASRFQSVLIVEDIMDTPNLYVGIPEKTETINLDDFTYTVKKDTLNFRKSQIQYGEDVTESDFISYEILSDQIYELGNKVTFKDRELYINEGIIEMKEGVLSNKYQITDKKGFHQNYIKNELLTGVSIEGKVIDLEEDRVKIFLDIDEKRGQSPDEACWFKYSTIYTSENGGGFYCMPELEEKVRLYFPDAMEEHAVAMNCVRTNFKAEGERGNPDIKYWRTKDGKEIMFTPDSIHIRCLDNEIFISLNAEQGILMQSSKPICIAATDGSDIELIAEGKIVFSADEELDLYCNGSQLNMKGGITKIKGSSILGN